MKRLTVGDLKAILSRLPADTIVCLYSDCEGNQKSTALDYFVEQVGKKDSYTMGDGKKFEWTQGDDTYGIDLQQDNGKMLFYLQPSL